MIGGRVYKKLQFGVLVILLAGCDQLASDSSERFEASFEIYKLTETEKETARAFAKGLSRDTGFSLMSTKSQNRAICYAVKSNDMPESYRRAHLLYLENYIEADKDYLAWFKKRGVDSETANQMGAMYLKYFEQCDSLVDTVSFMKQTIKQRQ
jgi:hypothetical protein